MDSAKNPERICRAKAIVDLAVDLGTQVVTTHIGTVPGDVTAPVYKILQDACRELGSYAIAHGVTFAIETGPETAVGRVKESADKAVDKIAKKMRK